MKQAQSQASYATKQTELMYNLFRDAVQKMEALVLENGKLWNQLQAHLPTPTTEPDSAIASTENQINEGSEHTLNNKNNSKRRRVKKTCHVATEESQHAMVIAGIIEGLDHTDGSEISFDKKVSSPKHKLKNDDETISVSSSSNSRQIHTILEHVNEVQSLGQQIKHLFSIIEKSYLSSSSNGIVSMNRFR